MRSQILSGLRGVGAALVAAALLSFGVLGAAPGETEAPDLAPANGSELAVAVGGDVPSLVRIRVPEGASLSLEASQDEVDVVVSVRSADGAVSYRVDGLYEKAAPEELFVASARAETWTIELRARKRGASGRSTVRVAARGPAGPAELARASADASFWVELPIPDDSDRFREAQKKAEEHVAAAESVVTAAREHPLPRREAEGLYLLAHMLDMKAKKAGLTNPARQAALDKSGEALRRAKEAGLDFLEPHVLSFQSETLEDLGRIEEAERLRAAAFESARRNGSKAVEARMLNRWASRYRDTDPERAIGYHLQAIEAWTEKGDELRVAFGWNNLGGAYRRLGRTEDAIAFNAKAIEKFKELGQRYYQVAATGNLAMLLESAGRREEAVQRAREGAAAGREHDLGSATLTNLVVLARLLRTGGDLDGAREALDEAGPLTRKVGGVDVYERERAALALATGDLATALEIRQRHVDGLEAALAGAVRPSLRAMKVASEGPRYDALVEVLLRLHARDGDAALLDRAFRASEAARARAFLQRLGETRFPETLVVDPDLEKEATALRASLAAAANRRRSIPPAETDALARLTGEVEATSRRLDQIDAEVRAANPSLALASGREPAGLDAVRAALEDDTVLLAYRLENAEAGARGHLWVVTRKGARVAGLASSGEIVSAVQGLRSHVSSPRASRNLTLLTPGEAAPPDDGGWREPAGRLARLLLEPAFAEVRTARRLVVVPDGVIGFVPFAALTAGGAGGLETGVVKEIVVVPSATALLALREPGRARPTGGKVTVFADPVYEPTDSRLAAKAAEPAGKTATTEARTRSLPPGFLVEGRVPRLPFSGREAEAIARIAGPGRTAVFAGGDATKEAATGPVASEAGILHFATHAVSDPRQPELSGLLLSTWDPGGAPIDGFLGYEDIYRMRLGADLVVLSACETGLGKELRGEGLLDLTRAFLVAGARGVVGSLWAVNDEATSVLMRELYRNLVRKKMSPGAALAEAQRAVRSDRKWAHPWYWAGFTLQGDWR